jgi:GLPGLI family protein
LEIPEWKLEKDTKNIGEYTCFKATFKRMVMMSSSMSISINSEKEEEKEPEQKEVEQTVTAWYTLQIPVSHGPGNYSGLPGLILEVSDGRETILCSKIVLNPKDRVTIKEPTKGKEVTQARYDEIMEKKMKEMNERMNSNRRNDGNSIEIRIGG